MRLCISSVLTTSIFVTAIILTIYPVMKSSRVIRVVGTNWIMLVLVCVLLRMFLPAEFFYTYTLRFTKVLTTVRKILVYEIAVGRVSVHLYQVLLGIWILGTVINIGKKYLDYRNIRNSIAQYATGPTPKVEKIVQGLLDRYPELGKIEIVYYAFISSPILMGIRHPVIVMPEYDFSAEDLEYILAHEVMHIRSHDTVWKLLIDVLCAIYWWNPAFSMLKSEVFHAIEIQNDWRLTGNMPQEEKGSYLKCLCSVANLSVARDYAGTVSFSGKSGRELNQRMLLVKDGIKPVKVAKAGAYALILAATFLSSCIILEPEFPVEEEGVEALTEENTYIIEENGQYKVYLNDEYLFTTDSLEYLPGTLITE